MNLNAYKPKENISLRRRLEEETIMGSVPCRVDCGNTLDIRPLALLLHSSRPLTVNLAIDLRTKVALYPFQDDYVKVSSLGFSESIFSLTDAPLNSPLGLIAAILCHFGVHGVHVQISSESPPKSGLGGSGALVVCTIAVISEVLTRLGYPRLGRIQQICLAQNLEEGLGVSRSGLQDQAAAMYGGVHQWRWDYRNIAKPLERIRLLDKRKSSYLDQHMVIAYTGAEHSFSGLTQEWIDDFVSGRVRSEWERIIWATMCFADALHNLNFTDAAHWLNEECQIRISLWPATVSFGGKSLIDSAIRYGCGARFCGGGAGGCIWAIGEQENIERLRSDWKAQLQSSGVGRLLDSKIAQKGLEIHYGV